MILPIDFHPHWHIVRPPLSFEYVPPPPPILDPIERAVRRSRDTERRAHQVINRRRLAQTGRVLSGFEQVHAPLRHCSACTVHGHDKATCRGCISTGHTRSGCPNIAPRTQRAQGWWENNTIGGTQSTQFGWEMEGLDHEYDVLVPATQYPV